MFVNQLNVTCELSVKVASYNDQLAVWELLVEPVEIEGKHRPWEIFLKVLLDFAVADNVHYVSFFASVYRIFITSWFMFP